MNASIHPTPPIEGRQVQACRPRSNHAHAHSQAVVWVSGDGGHDVSASEMNASVSNDRAGMQKHEAAPRPHQAKPLVGHGVNGDGGAHAPFQAVTCVRDDGGHPGGTMEDNDTSHVGEVARQHTQHHAVTHVRAVVGLSWGSG
jgi:hypothetical protein